MTEQEAVHQSVQERQLSPSTSSSPATMMWPLLEEYPSMNSPPRATSPVHFPHSSLPVREISQGNARIRLPLATTSKHLMMYDDNRFAKHPRFCFFALNTEMRWRALQTGRVYVKQNPGDAQLSLDELQEWSEERDRPSPIVCPQYQRVPKLS